MTATAIVSVSVDPAQMLICVNRSASAHDLINGSNAFCINILAVNHRKIAERFAGMDGVKGDDRFRDLGQWSALATGAPVLEGGRGSFDCRIVSTVAAATHTIYIGEVVELALNCDAEPLLYADGAFIDSQFVKNLHVSKSENPTHASTAGVLHHNA